MGEIFIPVSLNREQALPTLARYTLSGDFLETHFPQVCFPGFPHDLLPRLISSGDSVSAIFGIDPIELLSVAFPKRQRRLDPTLFRQVRIDPDAHTLVRPNGSGLTQPPYIWPVYESVFPWKAALWSIAAPAQAPPGAQPADPVAASEALRVARKIPPDPRAAP